MAYDYELIEGRGSKNARKALDQAVENGFQEEDVRTVRNGYLVPTKIAEMEYADGSPVERDADGNLVLEDKHEEFFASAKVSDLDDYIEANGLDVDKSLNKQDKIAAIKAALESKE